MTKLEQIEQSVAALSKEEMKKFAAWFAELQADLWDQQIEADAKAGRLDTLAAKALAEHKAGKTRPL
jgi:hypothetical protein